MSCVTVNETVDPVAYTAGRGRAACLRICWKCPCYMLHLADAKKRVSAAGEFCLEPSGFYCRQTWNTRASVTHRCGRIYSIETVEMKDHIRDCYILDLILPEEQWWYHGPYHDLARNAHPLLLPAANCGSAIMSKL
jgi:hypothetical protein